MSRGKMATRKFKEFVDRKARAAKKQLGILEKVLKKNGMDVKNFLEEDDPYIFVKTPNKALSFEGVRIYKIGNSVAYRVQKEEQTHPYGKAYSLQVEDMYDDLMSDSETEEEAGEQVAEAIVHELRKFFDKSLSAEKEFQDAEIEQNTDPLGKVVLKGTGSDYSNQVQNTSTKV